MSPTEIIFAIGAARSFIEVMTRQAAIMQNNGEITPEQLAEIKEKAALSDSDWDARVAAARNR